MIPVTKISSDFSVVEGNKIFYKIYEHSNHLGNVLTTISDRKLAYDDASNGTGLDYFIADVVSYSDYYPFGWVLPGRNGNATAYRYGYQGSEMDNEVKGSVSTQYTTYFRGLDTRIGRWWSDDPMPVAWESSYAVNRNSPIGMVDPLGNFPGGGKHKKRTGSGRNKIKKAPKIKGSKQEAQTNSSGEKINNWHGIGNLFRDINIGPPAGRYQSIGWQGQNSLTLELSGNPMDRKQRVNVYQEIVRNTGESRLTLTGLKISGNVEGFASHISAIGITHHGRRVPLFAGSASQTLFKPGPWPFMNPENGPEIYEPGDFEIKSGFIPFLNNLPTAFAFRGFLKPLQQFLITGTFAAWNADAFNHKPLLSGKIWAFDIQATGFGLNKGQVDLTYEYKAKMWQEYGDDKSSLRKAWHKLMWGND